MRFFFRSHSRCADAESRCSRASIQISSVAVVCRCLTPLRDCDPYSRGTYVRVRIATVHGALRISHAARSFDTVAYASMHAGPSRQPRLREGKQLTQLNEEPTRGRRRLVPAHNCKLSSDTRPGRRSTHQSPRPRFVFLFLSFFLLSYSRSCSCSFTCCRSTGACASSDAKYG